MRFWRARLDEHRGIVFKLANAYCPAGEERDDLVQEIGVLHRPDFKPHHAGIEVHPGPPKRQDHNSETLASPAKATEKTWTP